jgi:tyrosyl-tRNA synthetase
MTAEKLPIPTPEVQQELLLRGVADLNTAADLTARLKHSYETQTPLLVKAGFDPTAPDLHIGHTVLMEKMRQFQSLGHQLLFLVGDYTARIGDPTGRNQMRPPLTPEQITANAATYTEQCFKILDRERTRIVWNSSWLASLGFADVITLASRYNLARMLERRDFKSRFEENRQIAMHELLYPLVQGYDSVVLHADVELGGHDQIFNLNVGRQLMEAYGQKPQIVMTVPLLVGVDGVDKMSKSKNNHIGVTHAPREMFGLAMSISDETMATWYPLLLGKSLPSDAHPRDAKVALAQDIVARFHDQRAAEEVEAWWRAGRPTDDAAVLEAGAGPIFKLVTALGAATSGGDARRKIEQGGVSINGERVSDPLFEVLPGAYELKVGKKWSAKINVT